jgi:hypothetical protein
LQTSIEEQLADTQAELASNIPVTASQSVTMYLIFNAAM